MTRKYNKNPTKQHGKKRNEFYRKKYCIAYYNLEDELLATADNIYALADFMEVSPKKAREVADYNFRKRKKHMHRENKYHLEFIKWSKKDD